MVTSDKGIQFIEGCEGYRSVAYPDFGGVWTIGYGTTRYPSRLRVKEGDSCTEAQAQEYLKHDLGWAEKAVNDLVKVPLTQNQFDALVSFTYNLGRNALATSTLLKDVNMSLFLDASEQFKRWDKVDGKIVDGLTNRRLLEAQMFLGSDNGNS